MTEIEVPIEAAHEHIHHEAEHAKEKWISQVALSSALFAAFAAVAALLAGDHANEAVIEQIQASNQWNLYQAKSIKANLLETRIGLYEGLNKKASELDLEKQKEYEKEKKEISEVAKEKEASARNHLESEQTIAKSVTFFQLSIAMSAIAALVKRKKFWYLGLAFGVIGILSFFAGILPHA